MKQGARKLKEACLTAGKSFGMFHLASGSRFRNSRVLVLGYHGVSLDDEHRWDPALYISPESFRHRMELLKRNRCNVLSLDEAVGLTKTGKLPDRAVVLTFDDGTYDFYAVVWPILRQFGYPATVYLTTYYVDNPYPATPGIWSYMLWKAEGSKVNGEAILGTSTVFDLSTAIGRAEALSQLRSLADSRQMDAQQRNNLSEKLAQLLGLDFGALCGKRIYQLLKPEEVRELARDGASVQMHMHVHLSPPEQKAYIDNLAINRQRIVEMTGVVPKHFCYPSGRYTTENVDWLRDYGVESATTCDPGLWSAETEPLLIPRLMDSANPSDTAFESWVVGIGPLLSRVGGWVRS